MQYRVTIESRPDPTPPINGSQLADEPYGAPVRITFKSSFTLDVDLVSWIREEIDPQAEVEGP